MYIYIGTYWLELNKGNLGILNFISRHVFVKVMCHSWSDDKSEGERISDTNAQPHPF